MLYLTSQYLVLHTNLILNFSKTVKLNIALSGTPALYFDVPYGAGHLISSSEQTKFFGVTVDRRLIFRIHVNCQLPYI